MESRESLGDLTSCLPSFLYLPPFFPNLSLHSPSTRWTTNRNGVSGSPVKATSRILRSHMLSLRKLFHTERRGVWAPAYVSTKSTTTEAAPVVKALPEEANDIGDHRKNDRDRSTLNTGKSLRVHSCRRSIPGKIWMPTNQITAISARSHVSRELRAHALMESPGI